MKPVSKVAETDSLQKVNKLLEAGWILLCIAPSSKKRFSFCLGLPIVMKRSSRVEQVIKIKDEVSKALKELTENNTKIFELLNKNGELLAKVLKSSV